MDKYVRRYNEFGELIIASEACGGVIESNMVRGTDTYIPANLGMYLSALVGDVWIGVE